MLSERKVKLFTRAGILLPVLFVFYIVYRYGYTIPFWDEWQFVAFLEKYHNGTLTFTDYWAVHNEHRMLFPRILMLFLARISDWKIILEAYFGVIFACLSLYCLLSMLNDNQDYKRNAILKIVISLLLFSMVQYQNWLWSFSVQYFMAMTGAIAAIWSINKWQGQTRGLVIGILAAIFSNYSLGAGLFVWPSVFFMLLFQKSWKLKHMIIWIISALLIYASYFYKHRGSSFGVPMTYFLSCPIDYIKYLCSFLGASLIHDVTKSIWTFLVLAVITILSIFDMRRLDKKSFDKMIPWLALMLFAVINAMVIGMGRIHLGIIQSLDSRYTTISTLFVISVVVLLYNSIILNLERNKNLIKNKVVLFKDIVFILIVFMAFSTTYINNYIHGFRSMKTMSELVNGAAVFLKDPDNASDEDLKRLCWDPDFVRERMKILTELGYEFDIEE